jgi:outer membrane scaffolding protein for murein synthesis (MipA/OmpV family)
MWQWAAGCIAVAFLCVGLFGWYMHSSGKDSGYQAGYGAGYGAGYTEAKDEKAAAAWANTPEGRLAYRFAQTGSLASLAKCDRPGWYVEKGVCYVKPASDGTYGWRLP